MAGKSDDTKHWWNPDNLKDVAESVGIAKLEEGALNALQTDVEYRVYMVIQEAKRFMHAGKRTALHTTDISQALKVLEVEPLYGYESTRPLRFGEASLGPGQPLYYVEDEEVDFEKLINAPLPKVPRDMSFTAHWLAVEGVQPSIPQNPTTAEARSHELYPKGNPALIAMAGIENANIKTPVKHIVSKELRSFFDQTIQDVLNEDSSDDALIRREKAYEAIRSELGMNQLVPYFVSFISDKITHNIYSIHICKVLMGLLKALIDSTRYNMKPYLNSLIPPISTSAMGDRPISEIGEQNVDADYELRRMAGQLLGALCATYDKSPTRELSLRCANTCLAHLIDLTKPLAVTYGAIVGYCSILPANGIRLIFAPMLKTVEVLLERGRREGDLRGVDMAVAAIMEGLSQVTRNPPETMMQMISNGTMDTDIDMDRRREKLVAVVGETIADKILDDRNEILEKSLTWRPAKALGFVE